MRFNTGSPTVFLGWQSEKNTLMLPVKEGESNHFEIYPECSIVLNKALPSRETTLPEPNQYEFYQSLKSFW